MTRPAKHIIIGVLLFVLVVAGCQFSGFNKFTERDIPLLLRTYMHEKGTYEGYFAKRQLERFMKTPDGLAEVIMAKESKDGRVSESARNALNEIPENYFSDPGHHEDALDLYTQLLSHEKGLVRAFGYNALFDFAGNFFTHDDPERAEEMYWTLADGLRDPDFTVANTVKTRLSPRYDERPYPSDKVHAFFNDNDPMIRLNAAMVLAENEPEFLEPMEFIIDNLDKVDRRRQFWLIHSLRSYETNAVRAVPKLVDVIENDPLVVGYRGEPYNENAHQAAFALHFTGSGDGSIIERLDDLMYHPEAHVRQAAIEALGHCYDNPEPALAALKTRFMARSNLDEIELISVISSIESIYHYSDYNGIEFNRQAEVEFLIELLDSDDQIIQAFAARSLQQFSDLAGPALPRIKELLDEYTATYGDVDLTEEPTDETFVLQELKLAEIQIEVSVGIRDPRNYSILPVETNGN